MTGEQSPISDAPATLIDGHTDTLLALGELDHPVDAFRRGTAAGHLDLPRARASGYAGGFFAMFVRNEDQSVQPRETAEGYEVPYADPVDHERALAETVEMLSLLYRLDAMVDGFRVVTTTDGIERAIAGGDLFAIPHIEGAAAVSPDRSNLDFLFAAGIRSIGLTWSRPNQFGEGVPFRYPSSPDTGPGLTEAGTALVEACNRKGIICDLAHLNSAGFWDVVDLSTDPLVVTHAGAHERSPTSRNLTDDQLHAIADSAGVVGVQFGVENIRPDGEMEPETPISLIGDHVEYIAGEVGVDHVAIGSDFDGCTIPEAMGDVTGLPSLIADLRDRGFTDNELEAIGSGNWLRVLDATWG